MTKTGLKIAVLWAVGAMLSGAARAQAVKSSPEDQNQTQRSWSTRHLSATGREEESVARGSQLMGAQVSDLSGKHVGQIQDTVINPSTGHIDFALLSLEGSAPTSGTAAGQNAHDHLVPVPWALLRNSAPSAQYANSADRLSFTVNADAAKLKGAPAMDWSQINQSQWRQRIFAYYGVTPHAPMGAAETPQGEGKGQGAREVQPNPNNHGNPASNP